MWGQIAGAVLGGVMANKSAKDQRRANQAAIDAQMAGFNLAKPYISGMYQGGTDALNNSLDTGYYGGPTYAGINPTMTDALGSMEGTGRAGAADATNFMNTGRGFANNYADLYNKASGDMLGNAINYASANSEPLLRNAMRNDYRNLMENQLPQTGLSSSMTGNTNSSRRGVREAILERGYLDRQADTSANIQDSLINRSMLAQQGQLDNMTGANANLANLYGMGQANAGAGQLMNVGEIRRGDEQGFMNDARANFDGSRDFALDQQIKYNAGILNNAPQSVGEVPVNSVDPLTATLGGMKAGYGFGGQYGPMVTDFFTGGNSAATAPPAQTAYTGPYNQYEPQVYRGFG